MQSVIAKTHWSLTELSSIFMRVKINHGFVGFIYITLINIDLNIHCRQEIELTLDRLKKAERNLSTKEQRLREREMKVKERERKLEQQFCVAVCRIIRVIKC